MGVIAVQRAVHIALRNAGLLDHPHRAQGGAAGAGLREAGSVRAHHHAQAGAFTEGAEIFRHGSILPTRSPDVGSRPGGETSGGKLPVWSRRDAFSIAGRRLAARLCESRPQRGNRDRREVEGLAHPASRDASLDGIEERGQAGQKAGGQRAFPAFPQW